MSDLMQAVKAIMTNSWKFLTSTDIPGTEISFGVAMIGLALIPIGFGFLSLVLGCSLGDLPGVNQFAGGEYGSSGSRRYHVSDARKNDVR